VSPLSLDLNDLYLFAQVVECHGFTAAGDLLGIPKSRVSRRISQLEASLGIRLLQRTSRRLSLTDAGQELYLHCRAMVAEAQAGEDTVRKRLTEPSGQVRASLPVAITDIVLADLLPRFMLQYPKVQLTIQATNRQVDLIEENFDIVVRGVTVGLEPPGLVQARLCTASWRLVASPAYLAQTGPIQGVDRLPELDLLLYASIDGTTPVLRLIGPDGEAIGTPVRARLQSDNTSVLKQAALAGTGIASLPLYACADELKSGTLCVVLPEWRPKEGQLMVLFPTRRGLVPAVRALVDFLKAELPPLVN
jgi:DNA-binding transcriptional LysR family regulator